MRVLDISEDAACFTQTMCAHYKVALDTLHFESTVQCSTGLVQLCKPAITALCRGSNACEYNETDTLKVVQMSVNNPNLMKSLGTFDLIVLKDVRLICYVTYISVL